MTKPDLMKHHISLAFHDLMSQHDYSEITVQAIADAARINRKTFYYHFPTKPDLVTYIFRSTLADELTRSIPENLLLSDTGLENDPYRTLPFFIKDLNNPSSWLDFFGIYSAVIGRNSTCYRSLLKSTDWHYLQRYLTSIYRPQIHLAICNMYQAEGITSPPAADVDYLADYFTHSSFQWVLYRHATKEQHFPASTKSRLGNLFYDSISNEVHIQSLALLSEQG